MNADVRKEDAKKEGQTMCSTLSQPKTPPIPVTLLNDDDDVIEIVSDEEKNAEVDLTFEEGMSLFHPE